MGQKVITLPEHLVMLPSFFLSDFVLYLDRTLLGKLFGWFGLAYGVLTPLSTIFQLYRGDQFYCWGKPQCPGKIADLSQVTDKLYHIILYRAHLTMNGIRPRNFSGARH
jgi:hypothetical protein